ncbi:biliverdin-producing heme oxygenase [Larkinella sp. VNQ87]|uniref:biliverdin-producing heme oxygenase n=1 Tax=Larkinella sp. VNQ87 TaxID=3400921 RepID=UPI003C0D428E
MTLAERLRNETRALHEETEALLYTEPLRAGTLTREQYGHLLQIHWLFHEALETAIDQNPAFFQAYNPDDRRKAPWLEADLAELDVSLPDARPGLFADWSPSELLGAAYVGEGSMLGGKVVMHLLHKSPEVEPLLTNARFYQGYGVDAMTKWAGFKAILADQTEDSHDTIVEAAYQTFRAYHDIFRTTKREKPPVC